MNKVMINNNNDNYNHSTYEFRISNYFLQILTLIFLLVVTMYNSSNITTFGQPDSQTEDQVINIAVAGDFYCNDQSEDTIENIISVNPELTITTGDHVKDEETADCWIEMSKPIKDKMNIAIGNHDAEFKNIYKQIVEYHQLKSPYYSHDFQNIHFISISTEHPFEEGSKQYKFIKRIWKKPQLILVLTG